MRFDAQALQGDLQAVGADVRVARIQENEYRVVVPDHRQAHDATAILLRVNDESLELSDGGHVSFLLGSDFTDVADAMECGGAPFRSDGDELILEVEDVDDLAYEIFRFASAVSASPLVWHALACSSDVPKLRAPKSTILMAKEVKAQLVRNLGARTERLLIVDQAVKGAIEKVRAPLQFRVGRQIPKLVVACLDLTASPQAQTSAKAATSYLWDAIHHVGTAQFVLIRGGDLDIERMTRMYDEREVTVVSSEDPTPIQATVEEQLISLGL